MTYAPSITSVRSSLFDSSVESATLLALSTIAYAPMKALTTLPVLETRAPSSMMPLGLLTAST